MKSRVLSLLSFVIISCLVLQPVNPHVVSAQGLKIFVSADGMGTACSQAAPCQPGQGLTNAVDGDTIYFAAGKYFGSTTDPILTITKGVSLVGGWDGLNAGGLNVDPDLFTTAFDGQNARGILKIQSPSETHPVVVTGFSFLRGHAHALTDDGGAIYIKDGTTVIENNHFELNFAPSYGGAIHVNSSDGFEARDNYFYGNRTTYGGGAIHINRSSEAEMAIIENNVFEENGTEDGGYGGAIEISRSSALINANFIFNTTGASSSVLLYSQELLQVTNNILFGSSNSSGNHAAITAENRGGVISQIINNTIVNADVGIFIIDDAVINITNNIIAGCAMGVGSYGLFYLDGSHNLLYNNTIDTNVAYLQANSILDEDPLFVDETNLDFHIQKGSPARNRGTVVDLNSDFDGDQRPFGGKYDIGADEYVGGYQNYLPLMTR